MCQQSLRVDLVMSTSCAVGETRATHTLGTLLVAGPAMTSLVDRGARHVEVGGRRAVVDAVALIIAVLTADFTVPAVASTLGTVGRTQLAVLSLQRNQPCTQPAQHPQ